MAGTALAACGLVVVMDTAEINTLGYTRGLPESDVSVSVDYGDTVRVCKFSVELIFMLRQHTKVADLPVALAMARNFT